MACNQSCCCWQSDHQRCGKWSSHESVSVSVSLCVLCCQFASPSPLPLTTPAACSLDGAVFLATKALSYSASTANKQGASTALLSTPCRVPRWCQTPPSYQGVVSSADTCHTLHLSQTHCPVRWLTWSPRFGSMTSDRHTSEGELGRALTMVDSTYLFLVSTYMVVTETRWYLPLSLSVSHLVINGHGYTSLSNP